MPFIAKKSLGSASASATDAPITYYLDNAEVSRAHPIFGLDISLPSDVQLSTLTYRISAENIPPVVSVITQMPVVGIGPQLFGGSKVLSVTNLFASQWVIISRQQALLLYGIQTTATLTGIPFNAKIEPTNNLVYLYPDGSLHLILTVLRPYWKSGPTGLGQIATVWYPFSMTVEAVGYQLSQFSGDTAGLNIAACVEDKTSRDLYNYRPQVNDIQSDFVETQTQAIRVAENILWQSNMVLKDTFQGLYNPAIRRGDTVQLINTQKNINHYGIVKSVGHTYDPTSGKATTQVELRCTEYVFSSILGITVPTDKVDQRQ